MNNPFKEIDIRLSYIESLLLDIKHGILEHKILIKKTDAEKPISKE